MNIDEIINKLYEERERRNNMFDIFNEMITDFIEENVKPEYQKQLTPGVIENIAFEMAGDEDISDLLYMIIAKRISEYLYSVN